MIRMIVISVALAVALAGTGSSSRAQEALSFSDRFYCLAQEFTGADPHTNPDLMKNVGSGMVNAFGFWPPLSNGTQKFLRNGRYGLVLWMPGSPTILERSKLFKDPSGRFIQDELRKLKALTDVLGKKVWWDAMPEFDQSGGHWAKDRPRYDASTSRAEAYRSWANYYLETLGLGTYLSQPSGQRGYYIACVADYPFSTHYAYQMGVDLCLLERNNDELGDIATGIAFLRGAARQYDQPWGIDLSEWRDANDGPTTFNGAMRLVGGWSPSYHKRHLFIAYMSGAHVVHNEPVWYYTAGRLNPFGQVCKEFGDFALRRHRDVGRPAVAIAFMLEFHHGFDPKHGKWNQADGVWYQAIPYSDGDHMLDNLLRLAYPDHWKSGRYDGAPWADVAGCRKFLKDGGDPRPYEPMGRSRWGDNFDVILNNAPLRTLQQYEVILLAGDVKLTPDLKATLDDYVRGGGTVIVNASQVGASDAEFLGVDLAETQKEETSSKWVADATSYTEPAYRYTVVTPTKAVRLAENVLGDPLVTRRTAGSGAVILTTPLYLQDKSKKQILKIGEKLIDTLSNRYAPARISGPFPVEYIVNKGTDQVVVTVVNNSGTPWRGDVLVNKLRSSYTASEWLSDTAVRAGGSDGRVHIGAEVPPYDLRIYAVQFQGPATPSR